MCFIIQCIIYQTNYPTILKSEYLVWPIQELPPNTVYVQYSTFSTSQNIGLAM